MEMIAVFKFSLFFVDVCFACIPVLKEFAYIVKYNV